jgi:hypothetical protein
VVRPELHATASWGLLIVWRNAQEVPPLPDHA